MHVYGSNHACLWIMNQWIFILHSQMNMVSIMRASIGFSKSKSLPAVAETSLPFASELYYVHMYEQYTRHICNNGLFYYFLIVLCDYQ